MTNFLNILMFTDMSRISKCQHPSLTQTLGSKEEIQFFQELVLSPLYMLQLFLPLKIEH